MEDWVYELSLLDQLRLDTPIIALGRLGDEYGPLPREMFAPDCWTGSMGHASHDLVAFRLTPHPEEKTSD